MKIEPGMKVRFHPIVGGRHDGNVYTVSSVGQLGHGEEVAWLEGKRGCVALRALSPYQPGADNFGLAMDSFEGET